MKGTSICPEQSRYIQLAEELLVPPQDVKRISCVVDQVHVVVDRRRARAVVAHRPDQRRQMFRVSVAGVCNHKQSTKPEALHKPAGSG